jgi:hypothetical protein
MGITLKEHLASLEVPSAFLAWADGKTAQQAWEQCTRPDWLLFWAASTPANDTKSIKLATHDIASVIGHPAIHPLPEWARTIGATWENDPRDQRRVKAWAAWAQWCETGFSGSVAPSPEHAKAYMELVCHRMRQFRLRIPWVEEA